MPLPQADQESRLSKQFRNWEFFFDDESLYLRTPGAAPQPVQLENICRKTLAYLIKNPDRVITRDELLEHVWGVSGVTDVRLSRVISILRSTLGDDKNNPIYIQTIPKSGYKFIAFGPNSASVVKSKPWYGSFIYLSLLALAALIPTLLFTFYYDSDEILDLKNKSLSQKITTPNNFSLNAASDAIISISERSKGYDGDEIGGDIVIKKLNSSETAVLKPFTRGVFFTNPVWHPTERAFAYKRILPSHLCEIWYATVSDDFLKIVDEKLISKCATKMIFEGKMAWNNGGQFLLFTDYSTTTANIGIFRLNIKSSVVDQLTSPPSNSFGDYYLSPSKLKNEFIFLRDDSRTLSQLWYMDLNTLEQKRVHSFTDSDYPIFTNWLPDETGFVFQRSNKDLIRLDRKDLTTKIFAKSPIPIDSLEFCNTGKIFATSSLEGQHYIASVNNPFVNEKLETKVLSSSFYFSKNPVTTLPDVFFQLNVDDLELWLDYKDGRKKKLSALGKLHFNTKAVFSSDGTRFFVSNGDSLWLMDLAGDKRLINKPGQILITPSWSDAHDLIYAIVSNDDLNLISVDTKTLEQKLVGSGYLFYSKSSDGRYTVSVRTDSNDIMLHDQIKNKSFKIDMPDYENTKTINTAFNGDDIYVKCHLCTLPGHDNAQVLAKFNTTNNTFDVRPFTISGSDAIFRILDDGSRFILDANSEFLNYEINVLTPE